MHGSEGIRAAEGDQAGQASPQEKPANGVAGLKYWRHDLMAGLLVSLISLPLSLGIAVASGAPPIAGLFSAIIAGLLLPFLGGSYVTVSGPAAGLAPVLLAAMLTLGRGDLATGYPLLLVVISIVGVVQVVLSLLKAARFSAIFPAAVVEGMLASIGLMIIAKQLPNFLGANYHAHEFFEYLAETPAALRHMQPRVFGLGLACLALLFALGSRRAGPLRKVPPQLTVVVVGIVLGRLLGLGDGALIHLPDQILGHGLVLPNFAGLLGDTALWGAALAAVLTLTLVDGVESLATAQAIDKIDPFRRKSSPNRVLFSMGVLNIASSLAGGLTIIPGGVKSKACIVGGGRTLWANFYNAVFLLFFLFVARPLIGMIPLAALAAILIHTGYKMSEPGVWRHVASIGREQLGLFTITVVATLMSDLLIGIGVGIAAKLALNLAFASRGAGVAEAIARAPGRLAGLFRSPVAQAAVDGGSYHVRFDGPLVCFNSLQVNRALAAIPHQADRLLLHFQDGVTIIDHTTCENLIHFAEEFERSGRGTAEFVGMDLLRRLSDHDSCTRIRQINLPGPLPPRPSRAFPGELWGGLPLLSASSALQGLALDEALRDAFGAQPVHADHPRGVLVRLGMVPVDRYIKHPEGDLAAFSLHQQDPRGVDYASDPSAERARPIM
ncbi:SulP family inorganic anion transporter [Planctomyces sp. SH-PL62]|uniref:SulP family inorganic anion transporter n=1 Tax=Planctomyces sp. SH-PL62 TaxID=1636152 RepID=UPI00078ECD54|nr:SulP family inorganic anion transporter [Planctomyces sp. SH-PL62]AMV36113.1 Bicarbonate transporter BicA [Planctomyces sp. SH-PL62]